MKHVLGHGEAALGGMQHWPYPSRSVIRICIQSRRLTISRSDYLWTSSAPNWRQQSDSLKGAWVGCKEMDRSRL